MTFWGRSGLLYHINKVLFTPSPDVSQQESLIRKGDVEIWFMHPASHPCSINASRMLHLFDQLLLRAEGIAQAYLSQALGRVILVI